MESPFVLLDAQSEMKLHLIIAYYLSFFYLLVLL